MNGNDHELVRDFPNQQEISVAEAAKLLNTSDRTVINFIKTKKIVAVKVRKSWFVDRKSVELIAKKAVSDLNYSASKQPSTGLENHKGLQADVSEIPKPNFVVKDPKHAGLVNLSCYRLAIDIFRSATWLNIDSEATAAPLGLISGALLFNRLAELQINIIESLGAGYHSFNESKVKEYGRARAAAGSLVSIITASEKLSQVLSAERKALEEKLLPAIIALQRTSERRNQSKRACP